jgi:hypothetical protein
MGVKINARIIPRNIESKRGRSKKNDKMKRTPKRISTIILLKLASSIKQDLPIL